MKLNPGALFGVVLMHQTIKIKSASVVRSNVMSMRSTLCTGARAACSLLARGETKALCAILGVFALFIAAVYPVLRTAAAAAGAITAAVSLASRKRPLDGVLSPLNDGVNIGTAIPSGQQLSEMLASGPQNFTFAIVSGWQGLSLLLGRFLINLDEKYLDGQTFVRDEKNPTATTISAANAAADDVCSLTVAGVD